MATEVRMPQTPREQAYTAIAILALLGAGAYWYYVHNPKVLQLAELETRVVVLDSLNQRAQAELRQGTVEEIRAQTAVYEENLARMFELVPQRNEVSDLLDGVSTAARRAGLDIGPVDVLGMDSGQDFDAYRYRLTVSGGFHAIAQFLTNVGNLDRIVSPVNVTLNAMSAPAGGGRGRGTSGPPPTTSATFEVHTYVAKTPPQGQGGAQ